MLNVNAQQDKFKLIVNVYHHAQLDKLLTIMVIVNAQLVKLNSIQFVAQLVKLELQEHANAQQDNK